MSEDSEHLRTHFEKRFTAQVHSKLDDFERHIGQLEQRVGEIARAVETLSGWRKFEMEERSGAPDMHNGKRVIGRIPIWGSGRYLLVLKSQEDSFDIDII